MKRLLAIVMSVMLALPAFGQGTQIAFGGLKHDSSLPIEITAEKLTVDQADGSATFTGDVLIGQGEMRLSAAKVRVEYLTGEDSTGEISKLHASGGVTLVNGAEAAEAAEAVYTVTSGLVVMTGSVILTQGQNALSGDRLTVDLAAGTGQMDGRVKTILQPGGQ